MIDLERQKENFNNHVAQFTDYGNIKILDFKNPKSSHYRIRFLFEEDYCKLHISGDLGELIATNYNNMTYKNFGDFVHDAGYFEGKIDCHSRNLYWYNEEKARKDLIEMINEYENKAFFMADRFDFETIDDVIDDILVDFDDRHGISKEGYEELSKGFSDAWEFAYDLGKERTGILELYMLAFKLAQKQLKGRVKK